MKRSYQPKDIEQRHYQRWEKNNYFEPSGKGDAFCIVIPPPNITGTLHMGHAFQDTIMDALTRYHRMMGRNTLWQTGMDHAGIATQMVVERQLNKDGKSRQDMDREEFVEYVWKWKHESGGAISEQLRRMGASVDWQRDRFTMDHDLSNAVTEVFIRLYEEGLIYRGKKLVNWDPILHTALSDLEVLSTEEKGNLWHLRYPMESQQENIIVATTRPETMLGDSAVAVHPKDERYQHLIGKEVLLPLTGRKIPIIADDYVDPDFGSGCVKITPAHDFNDYEIGQRHNLPILNIFNDDAEINSNAPDAYVGLDRKAARKKVVSDLKALELLEKVEKLIINVPRGDRSGSIVEPYLTDQWYVDIKPLANPAIDAVKTGRIKFVPDNWSKTYFEWMNNIQDWCISRQLWWGHRIPAWYDNKGNIYVGASEEDVRKKYSLDNQFPLKQDEDVLDTWFSSALWLFSTQGWPKKNISLKTFYPSQVLVTGFDIIFFWVARMIMMGLKFAGDIPFKEIYIHGLIRDQEGQKMSKSKGNILDPIDLIDGVDLQTLLKKRTTGLMQDHLKPKIEEITKKQFPNGIKEYGTDALRYTFASLATTGRDIRFDLGRIEGYKNFCNKLWNASLYVLDNTKNFNNKENLVLNTGDRWIKSRLKHTIISVHQHFSNYRFDLVSQKIYEFTWHEFCDWYIELSKTILQSEHTSIEEKQGTSQTLIETLESILRLLHPIMPFITEEIWLKVADRLGITEKTIMLASYPQSEDTELDLEAEEEMSWVMNFISGIRQIRGEMNISPGKKLPVLLKQVSKTDQKRIHKHLNLLKQIGRIKNISFLKDNEVEPNSSTALLGNMRILVPLANLIDIEAETTRLEKQKIKIQQELNLSLRKLKNPEFTNNAPTEIIKKEKNRVAENERSLKQINEQISKFKDM